MRAIDGEALYEKACDLEAQALSYVGKIANDETKIEEWRIWSAILAERTAFKHDIFDAPTIEPEPCEDAVSRQAVYNVLDKMPVRGFKKDGETIHGLISLSQVNSAIINLPSAQPEPHWIPCRERLPEENGQYLITVKYVHVDGYDDIYAEHGEWTDNKWDMFCFGHCGKVENIIAWMPLPEPYREEE